MEEVSNCVFSTSMNFYNAEVMQLTAMNLVVLLLFHPCPHLLVIKTSLFTSVHSKFPAFWICRTSEMCLLRKIPVVLFVSLVHFLVICI